MAITNIDSSLFNFNTAQETAKVTAYKANAQDKVQDDKNKEHGADNTINNPVKDNSDRVEFSKETRVTAEMSEKDRAELVESLKADLENQTTRFMNMMTQMFQKQGITSLTAGSDEFWQTIASGNYSVDAATKAEAQEAISEDGYWGVKQTSQRLFDFAYALAGDDVDKMKEMQEAMYAGFEEAEKAWGGTMPDITYETREAADTLFEEYYAKAAGDKDVNEGATDTMTAQ